MTKENRITPMQKLKGAFDEFNDKCEGVIENVALNKVDQKEHPVLPYWVPSPEDEYSKGVKSDFIKVYNLNKKYRNEDSNFYCSMAFSFNYLDKNEEEESVRLSFKVKKPVKNTHNRIENLFFITEDLSIDEVRNKMKLVNDTIENLKYQRVLNQEKKDGVELYYEKLNAISIAFFDMPLLELLESNTTRKTVVKKLR